MSLKLQLRRVSHYVTLFLGTRCRTSIPIVFVVAYPKCGTTWVTQLVADVHVDRAETPEAAVRGEGSQDVFAAVVVVQVDAALGFHGLDERTQQLLSALAHL